MNEQMKLERDQALNELEFLRQQLNVAQARIADDETKLNKVKILLMSEAALVQ